MFLRSLRSVRRLSNCSKSCFSTVAEAAPVPNTSINWSRHWKGALLTSIGVFVATDIVYSNTPIGSTIRTIAESPTKWLSPKNIGEALDSAFMSVEVKSYLADRQPHLRGRPTLCVNLNGCIIATVYDSEAKRWVTYKRPGLDLFLERISQKYELVVWSNYGMDNALDVVGRLDPEHQYFHDTITKEIEHPGTEKDLQYLGRPLQRIIVMDHKPNANPQYTNNTIVIPEWTGGVENMAQDRTLYNILPFLDHLSTQQQVFDLPKLVGAYTALAEKEDKPLPFAFLDLYEKRKAEKPAWKFWA